MLLKQVFIIWGSCSTLALGGTITLDWDISWVSAAPDGFPRQVIGINGQWPCPVIEATAGDQIVINLNNQLGTETTSLHFHGISQQGTPEMDGPSGASQCPIPPGSSFAYSFTVSTPQFENDWDRELMLNRLILPVLTGIILIIWGNIRMACAVHLSFMTL